MAHCYKVGTNRELTENTLFLQTDDNLDSIGNLLEEKLDFHDVLNECKWFKILQSDVLHKHHSMD